MNHRTWTGAGPFSWHRYEVLYYQQKIVNRKSRCNGSFSVVPRSLFIVAGKLKCFCFVNGKQKFYSLLVSQSLKLTFLILQPYFCIKLNGHIFNSSIIPHINAQSINHLLRTLSSCHHVVLVLAQNAKLRIIEPSGLLVSVVGL